MNCAELELLICDYVDGTLTAAGKAEVERHLEDLPGVRRAGAGLRRGGGVHGAGRRCGAAAGADHAHPVRRSVDAEDAGEGPGLAGRKLIAPVSSRDS